MKKQLVSVLTAAAMLTGMSAVTAQASPRLVPYRAVLDAFRTRIDQGFENFADEDNTTYGVLLDDSDSMFSYLWYRSGFTYTAENAGYCFLDLNEDGTEELLLGILDSEGGWWLYDLYTLESGKVHHVVSNGERDYFQVTRGGQIVEHGSNGAAESVAAIYTIGTDRLIPDTFFKVNHDGYFMSTDISLKESSNSKYYQADTWEKVTEEQYEALSQPLSAALPMVPIAQYNDEIFLSQSASLGDLTDDTLINAEDAAEVLLTAARLGAGEKDDLTDAQFFAADTDSNGIINAADAANILEYAAYAGAGGDLTFHIFLTQRQ